MSTHKILYLIIGLVAGFAVGFIFANRVNSSELEKLNAEVMRLRSPANDENRAGGASDASGTKLTEEELRRAVAKGDASPNDVELQRNLGRGLYLYAVNAGNAALLPDAVRMLKRAHDADPKDYETTVLLGNALFDAGQSGDAASLKEARAYYMRALEMKPGDIDVRTDLGLTYFFDNPSDPKSAIREYRKSLVINPRHEMTLQNLAAALIATGNLDEAQQHLDQLQEVNPSNTALPNLRAQLAQKRNAGDSANTTEMKE